MSNAPRDPRQLARDILAGKVSIEELAREAQRRRAAGGKLPPQQRVPDRIPLPRTAPPPPPRPVIRQAPPPPRPQQRAPQQQQRTIPPPQPRRPQPQQQRPAPPKPAPTPQRASAPAIAEARGVTQSQTSANRAKPVANEKKLGLKRLAASRQALRQGIVLAEVLGKPLALRDDF